MTNKIIFSLSICLISILQSYPAPIHTAAVNGERAAIAAELQKGVDVNLPIKKRAPQEGFTPLALAIIEQQYDTTKFLVENNADVNSPMPYGEAEGYSPLFLTVPITDKKYTELLLSKGANVNARISLGHAKGFTPQYIATQEGLEETVSFLIDNRADVNLRGFKKSTALIFAAENGQLKAT